MALPKVTVVQTNGNLGRVSPSEDGIAALVVSGVAPSGSQFALGDQLKLIGLANARALGLDEIYDTANDVAVYKHIKDFYEEAGEGTELHLMVVAQTESLANMVDKTRAFAAKMLSNKQGRIKLLAIARNPLNSYTPVTTNGLDSDVFAAIAKAKELRASEAALYRYCQFIIEGRSFAGANAIATMTDLRADNGPLANRVSVCVHADPVQSALTPGYAAVGMLLGRLASIPVQRNIGRVKSGPVTITNAALSNGALMETFTDTEIDALNDKGYIFLRKHASVDSSSVDGFFFSNDWTATNSEDDYSRISRGRVMDKASRIVREVYVTELLDEVDIDPATGQIATGIIKSYQASAQNKIEERMLSKKEIAGVTVLVDPEQNVLSTDEINTEIELTPMGVADKIRAVIGFSNPANNT